MKLLHKTARSLIVELLGRDPYQTQEYEIRINHVFIRKDNRMILILDHLAPDTDYQISLSWADGRMAKLSEKTGHEFVTLNVKRFGAKGDGITDDTQAVQAAILSCPPESRVYMPEGTYLIRNLFLKSNMTLELGDGSLLKELQKRECYPVFPGLIQSYDETSEYNLGSWEGNPLDSMVSMINGIGIENTVICGNGILDGGGDFDHWWVSGANQNPPYRPRMIFLNRCRNLDILGITIQNSPSWNVHPYFCENIRIYGIQLKSPAKSHNTDGIDPESCQNVEIAGVRFRVGDDCIALKSGKLYMGKTYKQPSEHIRIRHCLMEHGHGAVTIGSEIAGGVRDVTVTQCIFQDTDRGLRIKTRRGRGKDSIIEGILFHDITMENVKSPFVVNCFYYCDPDGKSDYVASLAPAKVDERTPEIRSLEFSDITCHNAHHTGVCIYGLPEKKIGTVRMRNVCITYSPQASEGIAALMLACPPTRRQGIYIRNVEKLILDHVHAEGAVKEYEFMDVEELVWNGGNA